MKCLLSWAARVAKKKKKATSSSKCTLETSLQSNDSFGGLFAKRKMKGSGNTSTATKTVKTRFESCPPLSSEK